MADIRIFAGKLSAKDADLGTIMEMTKPHVVSNETINRQNYEKYNKACQIASQTFSKVEFDDPDLPINCHYLEIFFDEDFLDRETIVKFVEIIKEFDTMMFFANAEQEISVMLKMEIYEGDD